MKKEIHFSSSFHWHSNFADLVDQRYRELCEASKEAIKMANARYSNYPVGAAILLENGLIIKGNNQENAVYPLSLCAERVTLFSVSSNHPGLNIRALAVATEKEISGDRLPPFPCGSCRQVLLETEFRQDQNITLLVVGSNHSVCIIEKISDLLPFAFGPESL